ncbi:hypothetical protein LXL04_027710 [Taraxacum kok-saghyz]
MVDDGVARKESLTVALGRGSVFFYGIGHMLNDITAASRFNYLLVFMMDIGLSPRNAATVMLSGQIADGFTTIFAGELTCSDILSIMYLLIVALIRSMVNYITLNSRSRVVLTSCRNTFSMVSNLSLYDVAFSVFHVWPSKTIEEVKNQYRWIAYSSIFIGCCFVVVFHIGTKEPSVYVFVLAFLAFYVINDLRMAQSSKALIPAMIYICSFVVSIVQQVRAHVHRSTLKSLLFGWRFFWIVCGLSIFFMPSSTKKMMYLLSLVIGIANALIMVLHFPYSITFKSSQPLKECSPMYSCFSVSRYGFGLVPAICALAGVVVTCTMKLERPHLRHLKVSLLE